MIELIFLLIGFLLGVLLFPLLLFLRARRSDGWDDSNMMNIYRVIAHLATHPEDFGQMYYKKFIHQRQEYGLGKRPFWYIECDELSDVVDTRND